MRRILVVAVVIAFLSSLAFGQEQNSGDLIVDVNIFEPMVIKDASTGDFYGYEVDLVRKLADDLGKNVVFREIDNFDNIFDGIESGDSDMVIAGITINSDRADKYDFSYPHIFTGLQVLIKAVSQSSIITMAKVVFSKEMGWAIVLILSLLFIVGHLVWLLEQGKDVIADRYSEGISDAFWYAFCIISTVGEGGIYVKRFISRVISVATWFVASCVLLVYIFALVNSKMTAEEMKFHINDLNDLRGKKVAIVSGTHSEDVIRSKLIGSNFVSGTLKEAYQKLDSNRVDAVVFDAAPLLYRANVTSEPGTYAVVGNLFDRQEYGIAMPRGSRLTKEIDSLLLRYKGDSTLDRIGYKYGF